MHFNALLSVVSVALALSSGSTFARPTPGSSSSLTRRADGDGAVHTAPSTIQNIWQQNGAAVNSTSITYKIHLNAPKAGDLDAKLLEIANAGGPWLTVDELKKYTSVDDAVRKTVTDSLTAHGIAASDIVFSEMGDAVQVKSTIEQASAAFSATFYDYTFDDKQKGIFRTHEYTIPPALVDHVIAVTPWTQFGLPKTGLVNPARATTNTGEGLARRAKGYDANALPLKGGPESCQHGFDGKRNGSVTPACRGDLYGTTGVTGKADDPDLGIFALNSIFSGGFKQADLTTFLGRYAPDHADYKVGKIVSVRGGQNMENQEDEEAALDFDAAIPTIAPIPSSFIVSGYDTEDFFASTFQELITSPDRPAILSMSYGMDEGEVTQSQADTMCNYAKQLTALGTTIIVASGDNGVNGGHPGQTQCPPFAPTYPSGCPYITSIGATVGFPERSVSEDADLFWGGGGFTNFFPVPDWQKAATSEYLAAYGSANAGLYNATGRGFPDLSAQGIDYPVYIAGKWDSTGGTSASAPAVAAILTLINSLRKAAGKATLGWINPTLYKNAAAFKDVLGGGSFGCDGGVTKGFNSSTGWDPSSGLGSPDFAKLRTVFGV